MRPILVAALGIAAAACAGLAPEARDALAVDEIVATALEATRASPQERRRTLARAQQAFARHPDDIARLRLATLLAALPPPLQDEARAAALLEPLAGGPRETPIARFAALLAAQLAEQRRALHAGAQRETTLRRQLEALKAIERDIQAREERLRTEAR
jgi:hypothetical protein